MGKWYAIFGPASSKIEYNWAQAVDFCSKIVSSSTMMNIRWVRQIMVAAGLSLFFGGCVSNRLIMHVSQKNIHALEAELHSGVRPDEAIDTGLTPLMAAAALGDAAAIDTLIKYKANPNLHMFTKEFFYLRAAWKYETCLKIRGADAISGNGATALHMAAILGHQLAVERLLLAGADPEAIDGQCANSLMLSVDCMPGEKCMTAERTVNARAVIATLIGKTNVNMKDTGGRTALMYASRYGDVEIVKSMLKAGAEVNAQNEIGGTALMWAVRFNHVGVVDLLLTAGANPNLADKVGQTALFGAAAVNARDAVRLLLQRGANRQLKDKAGNTVLDFLEKRGQYEMSRFISEL